MMMKDKGKLVIWPAYIDQTKSRSSGRIISRKNAIKEPHLNEIKEAARQLGLNPEVEPEKAYPKSWWEVSVECWWMIKAQNPLLQNKSHYP